MGWGGLIRLAPVILAAVLAAVKLDAEKAVGDNEVKNVEAQDDLLLIGDAGVNQALLEQSLILGGSRFMRREKRRSS